MKNQSGLDSWGGRDFPVFLMSILVPQWREWQVGFWSLQFWAAYNITEAKCWENKFNLEFSLWSCINDIICTVVLIDISGWNLALGHSLCILALYSYTWASCNISVTASPRPPNSHVFPLVFLEKKHKIFNFIACTHRRLGKIFSLCIY